MNLRVFIKDAVAILAQEEVTETLKPYTLNARAWRIKNGYTTPEWMAYRANWMTCTSIICVVSFCAGALFGSVF